MRTDQTFTTRGEEVVVAVALQLAAAKGKAPWRGGRREKPAVHTVAQPQAAARLQAVLDLIEAHKEKWLLPASVRVVVSYEAGQDAFWICRALQARGIECYVVDPASIPVERHKRRAKTDRLDVIKLVINLRAWLRGERDRMHVVHVPSPQDEASRQLMRDRGELKKEVLQHRDRMRKLLATLGCWDEVDHKAFAGRLARNEVKCHDGTPLPPELRERLLARVRAAGTGGAATRRAGEDAQGERAGGRAQAQRGPGAPEGHRRGGGGGPRAGVVLEGVQQPAPGGGVRRAGAAALRQRREPYRSGHQQAGQPAGARVTGRDGVDLAALPARQRADAVVQPAHPGHGTEPPRAT